MTDYYAQFKEVPVEISELFKKVSLLESQLPKVQHRLKNEVENVKNLKSRFESLKVVAATADDQNSYDRYSRSLRKLAIEIETKESLIASLSEVSQKVTGELNTAKTNLSITLNAYLLKCRPVADAKINDLLRECVSERQSFLDCFTQIFGAYKLDLCVSNESMCPGIWRSDEIRDLRIKLGLSAVPEAPQAPQEAAGSAIEPRTTPDPYQTTPQAEIAPQTISGEVSDENGEVPTVSM